MIKFFRKIRQKIVAGNPASSGTGKFSRTPSPIGRYLVYAIGEIVLVVIGILIALQINDWNDKRIQNARVKSYAQKLILDLKQDVQNIKLIRYQAEASYLRLDSLTNYARALSIEQCSNLDIFILIHNARYKPYAWNRASFEEVKSSGILNYFDNDSLVNLLVKYEAFTKHMDLDYEEDRDLIKEATKLMSKVINYNYERKNMTFDVTTLFVLDTIEIIDYQKSDFYLELKQQPIDFTDRNKKKLEEAINAYVDLKFNFRLRYFIELPLLISNGIEIIQLLENNYLTEEISKGTIKRYRNNELSELMTIGKEIDEIIDIIKTDDHNKQTYDISERGINKFGYILMSQEKNNEALQIFKLNTELFPNQYNTYNSYGECLLKVSDEKNAIIAYKKSLELKADNTKAKNALDRLK